MGLRVPLLVFDWDGTLMDSESRIVSSFTQAIRELDLEHRSGAQIRNIIGLGLREALDTLYPSATDTQVDALADRYRHYFLTSSNILQSLFPGVPEVLESLLARGFLLAVATGKSRVGLDRGIREAKLERFFCASRCADETASKPDPAMLLELTQEVGVGTDRCMMIGDTEYDLEMAQRVGAVSIGANYGVHGGQRLRRLGPLACLDDIRELPAILDSLKIAAT